MSALLSNIFVNREVRVDERARSRRVLVIGRDDAQAAFLAEQVAGQDYVVKWAMADAELAILQRAAAEVDVVAIGDGIPDRSDILAMCERMGRCVLLVPDTMDLLLHSARTTKINDLLLYEARQPGLSAAQRNMKRCADVMLAVGMLLVTGPLMLIAAAVIRLSSGGPVLFRQERIGSDGRPFLVLKLRTMTPTAEVETGPVLASENDPRTTPIGRLLRATHFDELPQLFNVLRGDMSMIGPRPERPCFTCEFKRTVANYELRNLVRPGITGLAQIQGDYKTSAAAKLRFDLTYIFNYSLLLDLKILLLTFTKLFNPAGQPNKRARTGIQVVYEHRCESTD